MRSALLLTLSVVSLLAAPAAAQCNQWQQGYTLADPNTPFVLSSAVFDAGTGPELYVGGSFTSIDGFACSNLARWNGSSWSSVGAGCDAPVRALAVWDDGSGPQLYVGGDFAHAGGVAAQNLARWDGTHWSAIGGGVGGSSHWVGCLHAFDDGSGPALFVGGRFTTAGALACNNVARWNGASWDSIGNGVWGVLSYQPEVKSLASFDDGSGPALYVGGIFKRAGAGVNANKIARWNGAVWSDVGGSINQYDYAVYDLRTYDDGSGLKLVVAGDFTGVGGPLGPQTVLHLATWDGSAWSELGGGTNAPATRTLVCDDGRGPALVVGGYLTTVGINLAQPTPANGLARWDGAHWSGLDGGVDNAPALPLVSTLQNYRPPGAAHEDLFVSGYFTQAGPLPAVNFARYRFCDGPGEMFCAGDGTQATPCPCANTGGSGRGCENSASTGGAQLSASGTLNPDTLALTCQGELPSALSIFLQGDVQLAGTLFGDGVRCAGGALKRLYAHNASGGLVSAPAGGDLSVSQRSAQLADVLAPGSLRVYQVYYRDPSASFCAAPAGNTWNVSNALRVTW